jgi:DNA polymerase I-like protein with 3'-5' exonuclease and polymerase domains
LTIKFPPPEHLVQIPTSSLTPSGLFAEPSGLKRLLTPDENYQTYCGLDSCLTLEILGALAPQLAADPLAQGTYSFERALQAPYLSMMQRGFLVNESARRDAAARLHERLTKLTDTLNRLAYGLWGKGLNPRSPKQLIDFFYTSRGLALPEVWISKKGVKKISTDREALEKCEHFMHARPFISAILRMRDIGKQLNIFECEVDSDHRFRAGYNIAGTETGRPSSSENAFGTATNAQNIAPGLRYVFQADPGYRMCVIDLEQVEARDVGFFCGCLFDDWSFLDSCESGDLHTNNAKLIWPELAWAGNCKLDRAIADRNFYREFSYRDMAKRGSHLSNYMGTAWTAARALKVPLPIMEEFQARYCRGTQSKPGAFPAIPRWWRWTAEQLQTRGYLTTPFGRKRAFYGRPGDDSTLREAIAFLPQSTTADRMNLGLWRVWRAMPEVQLLAQTYDSITFQYRETEDENAIIHRALKLIEVELFAPSGRRYCVPGEAKVGFNWGARIDDKKTGKITNDEGLIKWNPNIPDLRRRRIGLDRIAL